jgi:hypothetical protein
MPSKAKLISLLGMGEAAGNALDGQYDNVTVTLDTTTLEINR